MLARRVANEGYLLRKLGVPNASLQNAVRNPPPPPPRNLMLNLRIKQSEAHCGPCSLGLLNLATAAHRSRASQPCILFESLSLAVSLIMAHLNCHARNTRNLIKPPLPLPPSTPHPEAPPPHSLFLSSVLIIRPSAAPPGPQHTHCLSSAGRLIWYLEMKVSLQVFIRHHFEAHLKSIPLCLPAARSLVSRMKNDPARARHYLRRHTPLIC